MAGGGGGGESEGFLRSLALRRGIGSRGLKLAGGLSGSPVMGWDSLRL